jgi:hypothetical protein
MDVRMIKEGIGRQSPAPIVMKISPSDLLYLHNKSDLRTKYRQYAQRADRWGNGLVKNPGLVGMVGEFSVSQYLNKLSQYKLSPSVDLSLREYGDGGVDFVVHGLKIQVKTRRKSSGYSLIRRVDHNKMIVPLTCDLFVFCQWHEEFPYRALLLGYVHVEYIRSCVFGPSPIEDSKHYNIKIPDLDLLPMNRIIDELISRSGVKC